MRPRYAQWLAANEAQFDLVGWTYLFHGAHRDISVDLPGIERLLVQTEASAEDIRELGGWPRRVLRWSHLLGDAWPFLGRRFASAQAASHARQPTHLVVSTSTARESSPAWGVAVDADAGAAAPATVVAPIAVTLKKVRRVSFMIG